MRHEDFWKLTYQELWLYMLSYWDDVERNNSDIKDRTWIHADLKAHISNFSNYKRKDGNPWTAEDFIKGKEEERTPEKPSLKKAKQILGSKLNMN